MKAIQLFIFIKEKIDGSIKRRAVSNRRPQRENILKYEAESPTETMESVLMTPVVDAKEERYIFIFDMQNAFAYTPNWKKKVTIKIKGKLAKLLVKTDTTLYTKLRFSTSLKK